MKRLKLILIFIFLGVSTIVVPAETIKSRLEVYNHINKSLNSFIGEERFNLRVDQVDSRNNAIFIKLKLDQKLDQVENDAVNILIDNLQHHFPKVTFYISTANLPPQIAKVHMIRGQGPEVTYIAFGSLLALLTLVWFIVMAIPLRRTPVYTPYLKPTLHNAAITSHRLNEEDYMFMELFQELMVRRTPKAAQIVRKCIWGDVDIYAFALNAIERLLDPVSRARLEYYLNDKDLRSWQDKIIPSLSTDEIKHGIHYLAKAVRRKVLNTKYQDDNELALLLLQMTSGKIKQFVSEDNVEAAYLMNMANTDFLSIHMKTLDEHSIQFLLHGSLVHNRISKDGVRSFKESLFCYV